MITDESRRHKTTRKTGVFPLGDNSFGLGTKIYRDTVIRSSVTGMDCVIGDDVFMTDSVLGNRCSIERRCMVFNSTMGDCSYSGCNSVIKYAAIGKFCSISWGVSIGGADHDFKRLTIHPFPFDSKYGISRNIQGGGTMHSFNEKLTIGNDVWIAANVCVTRGVSISDGAVIGAGPVVTHDVGPYEIWAGVPARKIGQRFSDEMICELLELRWWDWPEGILAENISAFLDDDLSLEKIRSFKQTTATFTK